MKLYYLAPAIIALSAHGALAAEASDQAKLTYTCAGAAGLASQLLEKTDAAAARQLSQRAQELAQSGVRQEIGRGVAQADAVIAMTTFLQARATIYRADPNRPIADLAACRASGMLPAGPTISSAQVAASFGVPAPPPRRAAAPTPAPAPRASPATAPVADAAFRRWLSGPWGRTKGGKFDSEMIMSTLNSRAGLQFTRQACPEAGLALSSDLLAHEIWLEERPGGQFGVIRASGDPGKTTTSWTPLTYKDQPAPDTWRYEFYNNFMMKTATLTFKRLGPDQISTLTNVPGAVGLDVETYYGRCRRR